MGATGMPQVQTTCLVETLILKISMLRICVVPVEVGLQTQSSSAQNARNKILVPKTTEVTAVIGI